MLSYHNDENLKALVVAEMKNHQKKDQFIKGAYEKLNSKFKGCAIGCTIDSVNKIFGRSYKTSEHKVFEEALGIPEWLAHIQDSLFEALPIGDNSQFAVDFLSAVPTGVNLEPVKWKFCSFILKEGIDRILLQHNLSEELMDQVVSAMRGVLNLHESAINTGEWDLEAAELAELAAESAAWSARSAAELAWSAAESAELAWSAAESARSAARSAAWSAESAWSAAWSARSAARSAAWSAESAAESAELALSAARSAAWSAESAAESAWSAESAEYRRYANELIRLLKDSK
jgi:hypothetical protein